MKTTEASDDWRETMPVWALLDLASLRSKWPELSGPVIGERRADLPSKMWEDSLLPSVRVWEAEVRMADGSIQQVVLWPGDDYARWWGEGAEAASARWPNDDRITGYPDHYIINGDPSSCGCDEHAHLASEVLPTAEPDGK